MNLIPKRIHAGALLLSVFVGTLIWILTAGLLLLIQYHNQYAERTLRYNRLDQNLASATNLFLTRDRAAAHGCDSNVTDLYLKGGDSVIIVSRPWGIYETGVITAFEQRDTVSSALLVGMVLSDTSVYALYLADEHTPLSLSGRAFIRGDVYLPPAGTRKSYIENEGYAYEEEIHSGVIHNSTADIQPLDSLIIGRLSRYLHSDDSIGWREMALDWFSLMSIDSLHHPFDSPPLTLSIAERYSIRSSIRGNIIIVADSAVTIGMDAVMEDVILFAPSIRFEDGFRGTLQAFARDSLIVGESCTFDYPSALGLVNIPDDSLEQEVQPLLQIDSASVVAGMVFSHFPADEPDVATVRIGKDAEIHGELYADGLLELRGTVQGITRCRRFTLRTSSSLYDNFVLGGTMDVTRLSPYYAGSALLHMGRLKRVMKWLE
ncbi:hypothetical protein [Parapedobacter sp. 10938]|uniref:hypothetical protein n=1 Tax=Parapedobacter flavus TaxID=3110225 RepID=UPI002DBACA84|nr:hypothetical protein [Parapedobacter sp. 10938]MEC3882009.1 hypothetical protein [Parapedobacter sp. 10938]